MPALAGAQAKLGHQVTIACRDYDYLGPIVRAEGVNIRTVLGSKWTKGQGGWGCGLVGVGAGPALVEGNRGDSSDRAKIVTQNVRESASLGVVNKVSK